MQNTGKLATVKKLVIFMVCLLLFGVGLIIGLSFGKKEVNSEKKEVKKEVVEKEISTDLTTDTVKDFLIAYYTKKDVGENKNRYETLVTTGLLNELSEAEKEPINQAYKGYIVNLVYDKADIYIDTENSIAICVVTYTYTHRAHKGTDEGALFNQRQEEEVKITFQKQGKKYLANKMDYVTLSQPTDGATNNYKLEIKGQTEDEQSTDSSTDSSTTSTTEDSNKTEDRETGTKKTLESTEVTKNSEEKANE